MAERRMFAKKVTDSDEFITLSGTAQALWFHLCMSADDDGFTNQIQSSMFKAHASIDDVKVLLAKRYIIQFESGVIVIRHWRMSNALRKDRYTPTAFKEEFAALQIDNSGTYNMVAGWLPNGCHVVATVKDSIDKVSTDKLNNIYTVESADADTTAHEENERESATVFKNKSEKTICSDVIAYLNEKAGTSYKPGTKDTVRHIRARLAEDFTLDDFKTVIDKMTGQWLGTEMAPFLRPQTLFSSKFESYLNGNYGGRKLSGRRQYNADGTYYQDGQLYGRAGTAIRENAQSNPDMDLLGGDDI